MRWLIDGYNVIRSDPGLRGQEAGGLNAGRSALLRRLTEVARDRDEVFTVVFDGARQTADDPPEPAGGRIEVVFARAPETADDVLRALAARWRDACVVVSSDRAVETAAWRAGAVAVRVEAFLGAIARGSEPAEDDEDEDDDDDGPSRGKKGNPHRASREQRAARRVLGRLRRLGGG